MVSILAFATRNYNTVHSCSSLAQLVSLFLQRDSSSIVMELDDNTCAHAAVCGLPGKAGAIQHLMSFHAPPCSAPTLIFTLVNPKVPRPDHAIAMAYFATDCVRKMKILVKKVGTNQLLQPLGPHVSDIAAFGIETIA